MSSLCNNSKVLGAIIRQYRQQSNLSQAKLAELMNLRQATLSSVENGSEKTHLKTIFDILSSLDLELHILPKVDQGFDQIEELFE